MFTLYVTEFLDPPTGVSLLSSFRQRMMTGVLVPALMILCSSSIGNSVLSPAEGTKGQFILRQNIRVCTDYTVCFFINSYVLVHRKIRQHPDDVMKLIRVEDE